MNDWLKRNWEYLIAVPVIVVGLAFLGWAFAKPILIIERSSPVGRDHGFFSGYWLIDPNDGWLVLRGAVCVAFMLLLIFLPALWARHGSSDGRRLTLLDKLQWALMLPLLWLVAMFAATDRQAAAAHFLGSSQCFSGGQPINRMPSGVLTANDALYFAIGNLTTAGTGSISPISTACRGMVAGQTVLGSVVILGCVGGILLRITQELKLLGAEVEEL